MADLTLEQASIIVDQGLAKGRALALAPLTVVVLDARGAFKAIKSEDGSSLLRAQIAGGKAYGCLAMGFGGRELARRAASGPAFIAAATALADGRFVPVPGGVLIRDAAGAVLGAVGISGDKSEQDEACAVAGITAAGLAADTGDAPA